MIQHYLFDELPPADVPFQCRECNARFHRRRNAVWHMNTEHGHHKSIPEAFTGSLRDLPVYEMVGTNLNPRWQQPRRRVPKRFRRRPEPFQYRERHQDTSTAKPTKAAASTSQPPQESPGQEDELMDIPPETEARYDAVMEAAEQTTQVEPKDVTVHVTHDQPVSESEDDDGIAGTEKEESESDSPDSVCWKQIKGKKTAPETPSSTVTGKTMDNKTLDESQDLRVDVEQSDAVADAIPVLQRLTLQIETATQEWCNLREVYATLTNVMQRNIRVMEQNNEYLRYRLLMDGGMHKGAVLNIHHSTQAAEGTSPLQRVDQDGPYRRQQPARSTLDQPARDRGQPANDEAWV